MRPTGPRSLTDTGKPVFAPSRPGPSPGRRRRSLHRHGALGFLVLGLAVLTSAAPVDAQELLAWWKRDLLPLRLEPGDWARFEAVERSDEGAFTDTLRVEVLESPPGPLRWIEISGAPEDEIDALLVDFDRLRTAASPLDAVRRLLRRGPDGTTVEEDLQAQRESRLVRRHLEDPFEAPTLERHALADTVIGGRSLRRERVVLEEVRDQKRSMGPMTLILETRLRAEAVLSPDVPLLGLLESTTRTVVSSWRVTKAGGARKASAPPLENLRTLRCLDSGHRPEPRPAPAPRGESEP